MIKEKNAEINSKLEELEKKWSEKSEDSSNLRGGLGDNGREEKGRG